jgi:tripartite-type tricarboxylate transporter receptor subunit TctC
MIRSSKQPTSARSTKQQRTKRFPALTGAVKIAVGRTALAAVFVAGFAAFPGAAWSQAFPSKPVRIIVPSAPGGSIDANARILSARLQDYWGQSVLVENRAGASMIIGAEYVAKSPADGYTLLVAHDGTMSMNPVVFKPLSYDPERDFVPISLLTEAPLVAFVHPGTGFNSIQDLATFARANPGKLNHASGGTATLLALELFNALAGTQITSVPYKGAAPALASVMAGETQLAFADIGSGAATIKSGKVKVLGVATMNRSKIYPDWPTITGSGVPGYETRTWVAAFAPAGTPPAVVEKIGNDMRRALAEPDIRQRFQGINLEVVASSAAELGKVMRADTEKWGRLIRERNIRIAQ